MIKGPKEMAYVDPKCDIRSLMSNQKNHVSFVLDEWLLAKVVILPEMHEYFVRQL
jgi:hypothetical protein